MVGSRAWQRPFVATRIGEIQMFTEPSQWQHVFTEENPADLCTREATPSELADSPLWWNGPDWLTKDFKEWSKMQDLNRPREMPEKKTSQRKEDTNGCTALLTNNQQKEAASKRDDKLGVWRLDPKRFSSWIRLLRVHARLRRVLLNMRRRDNRNARMELLPEEIKDAEEEIVLLAQREAFCEEYTVLRSGKPISKKSQLIKLNPCIDEDKNHGATSESKPSFHLQTLRSNSRRFCRTLVHRSRPQKTATEKVAVPFYLLGNTSSAFRDGLGTRYRHILKRVRSFYQSPRSS